MHSHVSSQAVGQGLVSLHPDRTLYSGTSVPVWGFKVPVCPDKGNMVRSCRTQEGAGFSHDSFFPPSDGTRWAPPPLSSGVLWTLAGNPSCQVGGPEAGGPGSPLDTGPEEQRGVLGIHCVDIQATPGGQVPGEMLWVMGRP